jgi:hypothetical protein
LIGKNVLPNEANASVRGSVVDRDTSQARYNRLQIESAVEPVLMLGQVTMGVFCNAKRIGHRQGVLRLSGNILTHAKQGASMQRRFAPTTSGTWTAPPCSTPGKEFSPSLNTRIGPAEILPALLADSDLLEGVVRVVNTRGPMRLFEGLLALQFGTTAFKQFGTRHARLRVLDSFL